VKGKFKSNKQNLGKEKQGCHPQSVSNNWVKKYGAATQQCCDIS